MHAELVLLHSVRWKYAARSAIRHLRCRCVCGLDSALVVVDPCASKPINHACGTHRPHNRCNNQVETLDKIHSAVTPIFALSLVLYLVNLFLIFPVVSDRGRQTECDVRMFVQAQAASLLVAFIVILALPTLLMPLFQACSVIDGHMCTVCSVLTHGVHSSKSALHQLPTST